MAGSPLLEALVSLPLDLLRGLVRFLRRLSTNKPGFVGFLGLLLYFFATFIMPGSVEFDNEPKLDQITGPIGSRIQLAVHRDNPQWDSLEALAGRTVGVVDQTGGPSFIEPYKEQFTVETYRWTSRRQGPGILAALTDLANQEIDALLIFSKTVSQVIDKQEDEELRGRFQDHILISNPSLGQPHLLGTDTQGRDIASHMVHGGQILILTALIGGVIGTLIALFFGSLSALVGGFIDKFFTALANLFLAIPQFILLVVLAGTIRFDSTLYLGVIIGFLIWPALLRAIRAQVLSLRERDFVEAARSLGLSMNHIIFREILPNMSSYVLINLIFSITIAMYFQIGLVVLGLAPISDYTWGVMIYFGRSRGTLYNQDGATMALAPVLAIALFQVCLVLFARAVEEVFDPRLRSAA
ncbi:MAG: ABC transporter permease subunit [Chloroflexi bacterium]|nr:ABC transporter permease subunit [Chloroflexota bacterium]MCY4246599.1 ABC transporter permease subunit [Chloroflexota bacterium]